MVSPLKYQLSCANQINLIRINLSFRLYTRSPTHPPIAFLHRITTAAMADNSSLDLLSRVALGQYHHNEAPLPSMQTRAPHAQAPPPTKSLTEIRYRRMDFSQPPGHFIPPQSLHLYAPPDYSPVSSDDGLGTSRRTLQLPGRITKSVRSTTKESSKSRSQPSRFCHICSRTSKKVGLVACGNFATGACRKVVCQKCFAE